MGRKTARPRSIRTSAGRSIAIRSRTATSRPPPTKGSVRPEQPQEPAASASSARMAFLQPRPNPGVFARAPSFAFNILKANQTNTLSQDRYRARLAGFDKLLKLFGAA